MCPGAGGGSGLQARGPSFSSLPPPLPSHLELPPVPPQGHQAAQTFVVTFAENCSFQKIELYLKSMWEDFKQKVAGVLEWEDRLRIVLETSR